jgi:anti-sigma B factor antagonist
MSMLEFEVKTAELGGDAFLVTAVGEADMYNAAELERALDGVVGLGGNSVVLDLTDVSFVDSTLLSVLLRYRERLMELGGKLVLVTDERGIRRTLEITGLERIFTIERRLSDGIGALATSSNGARPD